MSLRSPIHRPSPAVRHIRRTARLALVAVAPLLGRAAEPVTAGVVNRLAAELRTNHPALRARAASARAAEANAAGIRLWRDPELDLGGGIYAFPEMTREQGDLIYGLRQPLPLLGKEKAQRRVASAESEAARTRLETRFVELRRDLARALFEVALARRFVELDQSDLAWLESQRANTRARLAAAGESAGQWLRLENELSRRQNELTNNQALLRHAEVALDRATGRPAGSAWPEYTLPPAAGPVPFSEAVVRIAEGAEPAVQLARQEARVAAVLAEATRKSTRPDLALGAQGYQYSGDGSFPQGMFSLSVSLPWFNRKAYQRDIERDDARRRAAEEDHLDARAAVRQEVHRLTTRIASASREARLLSDQILPRTRTVLSTLEAMWTSGRGELREILETRRQLVEAERELARAAALYWDAVSELLLCCGLDDLETLQALAEPAPPQSSAPPTR